MLKRIGKLLVIFALVVMTGAHWAALQTVAWTTMLASNLRHDSFAEAVSRTFDGEHPCCMCKAIAAAKKAQKDSQAVAPLLKMEFTPLAAKIALFPPTQFELLPQSDLSADSSLLKPPVPPPRSSFA